VSKDPDIVQMQENELQRLINQAEQLRRRFDQYFLGIDKREPGVLRERLEVQLRKSRLSNAFRTSTRFRFTQFTARYRTYSAHWDRVLRQMEDGSYRKGFMTEAERLAQQQMDFADKLTDGAMDELDVEAVSASDNDTRIIETAAEARKFLRGMGIDSPEVKKTKSSPGNSLFQRYIEARKAQGDPVQNITRERFERSLEKQRAQAQNKHGVEVEFDLKVSDSKVSLVARKKSKKKK
jgi:hypothetical protein